MARIMVDDLQGYGLQIGTSQQQVYDQGMPIFNGSGEPKMQDVWQFIFTMTQADGTTHIVKSPWVDKEGKDSIVEALTGGVRPASLIDLPAGVDLGKL